MDMAGNEIKVNVKCGATCNPAPPNHSQSIVLGIN